MKQIYVYMSYICRRSYYILIPKKTGATRRLLCVYMYVHILHMYA